MYIRLSSTKTKINYSFQNKMIYVVYHLFNSFGLGKKPLLSEKEEPDQLRLPDYVKVSNWRFYEIKNNINNNKDLMSKRKDASGKTISIDIKDVSDLMDRTLKNQNEEAKVMFNDKILTPTNIIASTNSANNKNKLLRIFFGLKEVLDGKPCDLKTVGDKYVTVNLGNKVDDKQPELETQKEIPLELDEEKEPKFEDNIAEREKLRRQQDDKSPTIPPIPDLETEEPAGQERNKQVKGLKLLTPSQMLSRLPISLAQLNAGNNSEKLKNEIRQLLYSLHRSKKLTKQIYKSFIDII